MEQLASKARTVRDLAWFAPPWLYVAGFVVWAVYTRANGLGYIALSIPQYIAAGVGFSAFLAALLAGDWMGIKSFQNLDAASKRPNWLREENVRRRFLARILLQAVFVSLLTFLWALFTILLLALTSSLWVAVGAALVAWFLGHVVYLVTVIATRYDDQGADGDYEDSSDVPEAPISHDNQRATWLLHGAMMAIPAIVIYAIVVLPLVGSSFGGADERTGWLDIHADLVAPATVQALTNSSDPANGTVRTELLIVFHMDEDLWLVRLHEEGRSAGRLFELDAAVVAAVVWEHR
jgi:hypothetical protein